MLKISIIMRGASYGCCTYQSKLTDGSMYVDDILYHVKLIDGSMYVDDMLIVDLDMDAILELKGYYRLSSI